MSLHINLVPDNPPPAPQGYFGEQGIQGEQGLQGQYRNMSRTGCDAMPFAPPDRPVTATPKPTTPGTYFKRNGSWVRDKYRLEAIRELYEALLVDEDFETYLTTAFNDVLVVPEPPKPPKTFVEMFRETYKPLRKAGKEIVAYATTEQAYFKFLGTPLFFTVDKYESFRRKMNLPGEIGMLDGVRVVIYELPHEPIAKTEDGMVVFCEIERNHK
jgi:hypothetical protein